MNVWAETDLPAGAPLAQPSGFPEPQAIAPAQGVPAGDDSEHALPGDHPAWPRDRLALSAAARALVAALRPVALIVRTFWDHRVRSIFVGGQRLSIDASGSYRIGHGALG